MSKLTWDDNERYYHMGVSKGVMYLQNFDGTYGKGVAWSGLRGVDELPTGGEINKLFADNMVYASLRSSEGLEGSIEAYSYPDEFVLCNGAREPTSGARIYMQPRKSFGMCYRTELSKNNYLLHILYGINLRPGERTYQTINDSPDILTHSWDFITTPVITKDYRPTASVTIDTRKVDPSMMEYLEKLLYGSDEADAYLPPLEELIEIVVTYGLRVLLVAAVSTAGFWRWDPFNFEIDTIPIAIERESETRVIFNPSEETSYAYPCIIYRMLSDVPDEEDPYFGMRHYSVTVITETQTSSVIDAVEDIPECTLIESYVQDSLYYNIYSIYY